MFDIRAKASNCRCNRFACFWMLSYKPWQGTQGKRLFQGTLGCRNSFGKCNALGFWRRRFFLAFDRCGRSRRRFAPIPLQVKAIRTFFYTDHCFCFRVYPEGFCFKNFLNRRFFFFVGRVCKDAPCISAWRIIAASYKGAPFPQFQTKTTIRALRAFSYVFSFFGLGENKTFQIMIDTLNNIRNF